jgi:hypothetical protein
MLNVFDGTRGKIVNDKDFVTAIEIGVGQM